MTTCDEIETSRQAAACCVSSELLLFFAMQGVAAILVGFAAFFLSFEPVWSAEGPAAALARPGDARSGSLLLKTEGWLCRRHAARHRRRSHGLRARPSAPASRRSSATRPQNWVEATYVYPLPDGGAVDTLKMVVGDRVVVGEIKERQQARVIYEQARANGQQGRADRAGAAEHLHQLGRQYRPRRNRAGADRISGAGAAVRQRILAARADGGRRRATIPRRSCRASIFAPDSGGWGATTTDPVPDRDRISPTVLDPAQNAPVNPTSITVRLQAGFPLGEVKSHHHQSRSKAPTARTRIIKLAEGPVPADRDFELTWKPAAEKAPSVGLFREHVGDADYLLAFVTPPAVEQAEQKPLPREVIFVIDNSGSMGGTSIVQAKASLIYALGRLQPNDRFNVIRFDHTMDVLFPDAGAGRQRAHRQRHVVRRRAAGRAAAPRWCRRCARR